MRTIIEILTPHAQHYDDFSKFLSMQTRFLKIRSGFYADSAMNKHGAIANTTAQGPVRSQNTEEGAVRSVPL